MTDGRLPFFERLDGKVLSAPRTAVMAARVIALADVVAAPRPWFKVPAPAIYDAISSGVIPPPLDGLYVSREDLDAIQEWYLARSDNVTARRAPEYSEDAAAQKYIRTVNLPLRGWFEEELWRRQLSRRPTPFR